MIMVAPSILAADPLAMGRDVRRMEEAGADWLHVDIMDAHFVPNLSFGPSLVKALKGGTKLPLDVHLMMDNPQRYLETFAKAGAAGITVHAEIDGAAEALRTIRGLGLRAGLSLKPHTPVDAAKDLLPLADLVLIMTVEPGFGGQAFMADMVDKAPALRAAGFTGLIETDGGVAPSNLQMQADKGVQVFVMGTALFKAERPEEVIRQAHGIQG